MLPRTLLLLCLFLVGVVALAACSDGAATPGDGRVEVTVGEWLTIRAETALTPDQRTKGLGGRDTLPEDAGMLFVFPSPDRHTFCMCGMRFPLDFVWIGPDLRVVDVTRDVPPPAETGGDIRTLDPAAPVLYVLELNAGSSDEAGVAVGDAVSFEPEVSPDRAS